MRHNDQSKFENTRFPTPFSRPRVQGVTGDRMVADQALDLAAPWRRHAKLLAAPGHDRRRDLLPDHWRGEAVCL